MVALAESATAQATFVVGTGNPDVDIPAVQTAVDQGGQVFLKGHFSFDRAPSVPNAVAGFAPATVLISKAVAISGVPDEQHDTTSIEAGSIPFYIDAPGAGVTIRGLHFVRPTESAILAYAVSGLTIASCRIEGIMPVPHSPGNSGIFVGTISALPTPTQPGYPDNISGQISIVNNDIDAVGGTALDNMLGITIFSVGQSPDMEVDIYVSGNTIRNITEPAINFRRVGGKAHVTGNVIETGPVSAPGPEVIRAVNIGSYVIAHNSIKSEWADPDAKGISVFSQFAAWPMEGALVVDNDVTMSPPVGTVFTSLSAGIEIRGYAGNNLVAFNRVHGSARAALALDPFKGGIPHDNVFKLNRVDDFDAAIADVYIGTGVLDTHLFGQEGTVDDLGTNTIVLPF
jgi:hypothetical protein